MADGDGDSNWERHLAEHQRIWETVRGLVERAKPTDERIEALRQAQLQTNTACKGSLGRFVI